MCCGHDAIGASVEDGLARRLWDVAYSCDRTNIRGVWAARVR